MTRKVKNVSILAGALLAIFVLALPKIGSFGHKKGDNDKVSGTSDSRIAVRMQTMLMEKIGDKVATVGTILPNEQVEIRSEISGKIDRIFFKEGGKVKKGQTLLKINDAELQSQLVRAQNRQAIAERQEQRQGRLHAEKLISREEYDNSVNEFNISQAEAQLMATQIDKTEIRAPFGGMIGLRFVSEGSYITPATPITTLQDNSVVKIDFKIPEKYAAEIGPGGKINFSVHGMSRWFDGTVYARDTKIDPATRTMQVLALSPNPDGVLLPGSFARVEVVSEEKTALMIPAEALIPELKGHKVFLCKGGKAVSQSVEIGIRTDERVEIIQGVQAGDTLITSAILQLRPGMAVRPAEAQQLE